MSDHLEDFLKNNRDKLDQSNPGSNLWNNINQGLNQAGAGGSAAGGAGAKATAAKLAVGWKIAAIVATVALTTVGLYYGLSGGGNGADTPGLVAGNDPGKDKQIELLQKDSPFINPPITNVNIPFGNHTVDGEKGGQITLENGTIITAPENAFVFADGTPVTGPVEIKYREFHDAADIILSGIPMKYDENGQIYDFQTAGMVEIGGSQGEKTVYIAQNKTLEIAMASFVPEDDYNLYFLDQEDKKWKDIGKAKLGNNKAKEEGLRLLKTKPSKPVKATEEESTFDFSVNYGEFPELKPFKKIVWQLQDESRLKEFDWVFNQKWREVELVARDRDQGKYTLKLRNATKKIDVDIVPALTGKDYDKAMADFRRKAEKYEELIAQRDLETARLNAQADVLRTFPISNFGIFNCDRFYRTPNTITVDVDFDFGDENRMKLNQVMLFHIVGNQRAVLPYMSAEMKKITFAPSEDNYFVAILPGNRPAVFYPKDFKAATKANLEKSGKMTVKFHVLETTIGSANDLRAILNV